MTTLSIDFYYYATSTPQSSALACPNWNSQTGAPVTAIQQVPYVSTIWKVTYQIQELTYYVVNWFLTRYTSTSQLNSLISAVNQATSANPSVYIPSYRDLNIDTLNSLRYQFCFAPEPLNEQYCPEIPNYNSTSENVRCSRIVSTNQQYNNSMDASNKVRCSQLYTELTDPKNDRYSDTSAVFRQYCSRYPESYDCQCFARAGNNLYQQTKDALGGAAVNDVCWYKPCSFQTNIFVPSELLNAPASCPSACANVIIAADVKGKVDINNVSMNNTCFRAATIETVSSPTTIAPNLIVSTFSPFRPGASLQTPNPSVSTTTTTTSLPPVNKKKLTTGVIIGIVVGCVLFLLIVGWIVR